MDKKDLKVKLNEVLNKLRTNSRDTHFFDTLIDEALSLKGQISVEPIALDCGVETDEWQGETFRITLTNKGVLYHEYGGYSVFVTPKNQELYGVLSDLVINREKYSQLEGEEKDNFHALLSIIAYNLSLPRIAFLDNKFPQEIAIRTMEFIANLYQKLMSEELKGETVEKDVAFRDTMEAIDIAKKALEEFNDEDLE